MMDYYWAETKAAQTSTAEMKAASLVAQSADMKVRMMACETAASLVEETVHLMVRMMGCLLVEKTADMMVRMMDC